MEEKRFRKNDEGFTCAVCGRAVPPLGFTSRNHCPFCLSSVHLDVNPGDRAAECGGIMDAFKTEPDPKKGFIIYHKCRKCGAVRRNRAAMGDCESPDDMDMLIRLTAGIL